MLCFFSVFVIPRCLQFVSAQYLRITVFSDIALIVEEQVNRGDHAGKLQIYLTGEFPSKYPLDGIERLESLLEQLFSFSFEGLGLFVRIRRHALGNGLHGCNEVLRCQRIML